MPGMIQHLEKKAIIAREGFNRWKVPPAALAIHLCIGSVYSWSIFNPTLTRSIGVVAPASDDWTLSSVVWIFSVAIACLGLSAAFGGKWLERVGPRMVGVVAALCWGGGFLIGGVGILTHQLWLLYLGYGVLGGCGLGLGYVSPVSTLIRWFPDRRGMATGMAIMGFGGGAIIGAPLKEFLIKTYYQAPEYLGSLAEVSVITQAGKRFAETAAGLKEVVVVSASDLGDMIVQGPEGVYIAGTGNTGVAATFFTLGVVYLAVMLAAAFAFRVPAEGWTPKDWVAPSAAELSKKMQTTRNVHIDQALKTPQFYLLWIVLCFNVTAGIGVLGVAKTMMNEIFGAALPLIVTGGFAATYVMMISVFNMGGRFFWASISDYLGRKKTYAIFFVLGIALYMTIPFTAAQTSVAPSILWLGVFYAVTMVIFTMYGGGFATIPAYLADIFGTKYVGGIHGRLLTAWSAAGILGPMAITSLREMSINSAAHNLAQRIDPQAFAAKFGAGIEQLDMLLATNVVTIGKLMEIAPAGTIDPTSTVYNTTMYCMAGLLFLALLANLCIRPCADKHYMEMEDEADRKKEKAAASAANDEKTERRAA